MEMLRACVWTVLLCLVAGCSSVGSEDDGFDVELLTDRSAYIADSTEVIRLSLTNRSEAPLHYICEIGISLEELDGGAVMKEWGVRGICESLAPGSIPAGGKRTFELSFRGINDQIRSIDEYTDYGEARFDRSIDYRLVIPNLYAEPGDDAEHLLPLADRVSNLFKIERPAAN